MLRIDYYSDCPFFAGCEAMLANFVNSSSFNEQYDLALFYRHSGQYVEGMNKRMKQGVQTMPIFFPDLSTIDLLPTFISLPIKRVFVNVFRLVLTPVLFVYEMIYLFRLFKKRKPDILHLNNGGYPGALSVRAAAIAAKLAGVSRVLMVVNNLAEDYKRPSRWLDYPVDFMVSRCVHRFVTGSNAAASRLKTVLNLPSEKIVSIHNGITQKAVRSSQAESLDRLGLNDYNGVLFGVVALLIPRKGHQVLLEAVLQLKNDGQLLAGEFKILIEGHGYLRQNLMGFVKSNALSEWVAFVGDEKHIVDFMSILDVLVLPSINNEDFPNVIIEAMSLGKPVIASELAGTPEQVVEGVTGCLVEPADVIQLSKALRTFVDNKSNLPGMGKAALNRYKQYFTSQTALSNYSEMYRLLAVESK